MIMSNLLSALASEMMSKNSFKLDGGVIFAICELILDALASVTGWCRYPSCEPHVKITTDTKKRTSADASEQFIFLARQSHPLTAMRAFLVTNAASMINPDGRAVVVRPGSLNLLSIQS